MAQGKAHFPGKQKRNPRGLNKATMATIAIKGSKPGKIIAGHEARLNAYVKRAVALKRLNYYHWEIARLIQEEFQLVSEPAVTTVADWLKKGNEAIQDDIKELQMQWRLEQWAELDRLKAKWMPIATAQALEIQRWKMVEGTIQPILDENALAEQLDATKAIVAIMARQAKLLALDIDKSITATGEGPESLQALQVIMINHMAKISNQPQEKVINGEVLELKSGLEDEVVDAV